MQEPVSRLVHEIERIVTAPYAPSLLDLIALVHNSSATILQQWAECKPCQVPLLAAVILEQQPHSTVLLGKFAYVPRFRDSVLKQDPVILDQLLQSAIDTNDPEAINASIALLSCPLAGNVVVPATLPLFLTRLLQDMVHDPCAKTMRPLYEVMGGFIGNLNIVKTLPEELMESFQLECTKTLRNLNDYMGSLLGLATFARIRCLWTITASESSHLAWLTSISHFFGPKRAGKTLDLVILSVIVACSATGNAYSPEDAIKIVKLAIEICESIDHEQKSQWLSNNKPKMIKLCERLTRQDIDVELQMMGLVLLVTFSSYLGMRRDVQNLIQRQVCSTTWSSLNALPDQVVKSFFEQVMASVDKHRLSCLISRVLSAIQCDVPDQSLLAEIMVCRHIILAVRKLKPSVLHHSCLRAIPSDEEKQIRNYMERFVSEYDRSDCRTSPICDATFRSGQDMLFLDLLACYHVAGAIMSSNDNPSYCSPHDLILSFLTMMKTKNRREIVCQFSRKKIPERSSAQISLAESSPGESRGFSREWREKVAASLLENAATSHQLVVKQMEKICCDLESRCRNVEEPLRRVEEERDSLDSQLQEAKRLNMDLDLQAIESSELITRLKTDLSQLADREQNSSREAQTLANDLHALQTEFSAMKQEVEETAELDRTRAKTRELDLMAIVTERCDQLEELQMEMENLRLENIKLKEGSQLMVAENDVVVQDRNALRSEISRLRQDLEDRNTWIHEKDDHIQALNNTNRSLTGDIQVIQLNFDQEKSSTNSLRSSLEIERQTHRSAISELTAKIESHLSGSRTEAIRHQQEISALRLNLHNVESKADRELQSKTKRIQHLEEKIGSLRNERAAKAREFSEAQEHISRLMSVMGFTKEQKEDNQTLGKSERFERPHKPSRLAEVQTQPILRSQEDPMSFQDSLPPTVSFHDSPSSRQHHRLSFQTGQEVTGDSEIFTGSDRLPLGDIDKNSPPKSQAGRCKRTVADRGYPRQIDQNAVPNMEGVMLDDIDLDFNESDLFISTAS